MSDLGSIAAVARELCGGQVGAMAAIAGGGNNRIYRIEGTNGGRFALKTYFAVRGEGTDRLDAEFGGLSFLWREGLRDIPEPVAADRAARCALFGWVEGDPVAFPGAADIDAALDFVRHLRDLARAAPAGSLPLAREACLSADELHRQIRARHARLQKQAAFRADLAQFLRDDFDDALTAAWRRARDGYAALALRTGDNLDAAFRTLSPSDFGFHNAMRTPDGRLVFCDFEYFGWDDPVKLVADFLLHPGMALKAGMAKRFERGAAKVFADDPAYADRLQLLKPLYALRWAMIVLGEFLPEKWAQRAYARGDAQRNRVLATQLAKARAFVARAGEESA